MVNRIKKLVCIASISLTCSQTIHAELPNSFPAKPPVQNIFLHEIFHGLPLFRPQAKPPAIIKYVSVLSESRATFKAITPHGAFPGKFKKYHAKAWINQTDRLKSTVHVTIDMDSITMNSILIPDFAVKKALQTDTYPTSYLKTLRVRPTTDPAIYNADVEFSFIGKVHKKNIDFQLIQNSGHIRVIGSVYHQVSEGLAGVVDFNVMLRPAITSFGYFK
ncbi:YceI family protein [Elusimicrobiota bacterium]